MPNLTSVGITAGVPTSGTGTVSTLDNLIGTAGTPTAQVQSVQGVTSMTPLKVDGSGVTQPVSGTVTSNATLAAETTKVIGVVRNADGTGNLLTSTTGALDVDLKGVSIKPASTAPLATDTSLVVAVSPNSINANGRALPANSSPVVLSSHSYEDVAASQSAQVLGGTGAAGDWLEGVLIIPETTAAGTVALLDGATSVNIFVTGTLTSLIPFFVPFGCVSQSGAWKITTGANVHVRAIGDFT